MRLSTYEIILPLLDKDEKEIADYRLMVNGLYGAFDIISKENCEKISAGKFSELPLAFLEKFLLRGHLTRKNESEELADMKLLARLHKKVYGSSIIGLIIMPTYDCNFRCPYCFEQHRLNKEKDWLSQTISDEIIDSVFSALKDYKSRGYNVDQCTFYGGEPLLEKNLPVVRKIAQQKILRETDPKAKTKRGSFSYYFKAITNDFKHEKNILREKDILDELIKYGITTEEAFERESQYSIAANLKNLFQKKNFASFAPIYCGAERNMAIVDPFGKIFPCWDFVGKDDKAVGFVDIKTGRFLWNFDKAKWKTRTVDIMEKCKTCPYCFICRGGCASRADFNTGNCFREDCGETKEIFNLVASLIAGAHWKKHHEQELSLSLAGPLSRLTQKEREIIMTTKSQKEIFELAKTTGLMPENIKETFIMEKPKLSVKEFLAHLRRQTVSEIISDDCLAAFSRECW